MDSDYSVPDVAFSTLPEDTFLTTAIEIPHGYLSVITSRKKHRLQIHMTQRSSCIAPQVSKKVLERDKKCH